MEINADLLVSSHIDTFFDAHELIYGLSLIRHVSAGYLSFGIPFGDAHKIYVLPKTPGKDLFSIFIDCLDIEIFSRTDSSIEKWAASYVNEFHSFCSTVYNDFDANLLPSLTEYYEGDSRIIEALELSSISPRR